MELFELEKKFKKNILKKKLYFEKWNLLVQSLKNVL